MIIFLLHVRFEEILKVRDQAEHRGLGFPVLPIVGCILGNLFLRAGSAAAISILTLYLAHIDRALYKVPATFLGTLAVAFFATELTCSPIFGSLSDRFGRRVFMWLGAVFGAGGALVLTISPALPLFIIARLAQGLSAASSVPAVLGYLAAETTQSVTIRGRIMVAFESATILGFALGFAFGGVMWDKLHASAFYAVLILYGVSLGAFAMVRGSPAVESRFGGWQFYRALLSHAPTLSFAPAWVAINAVLGLWFTHLGFQMAKMDDPTQLLVGGFSGSAVGLVSAAVAVIFVAGTAGWALAFGRVRIMTIMAGSLLALAIFCLVLYSLNHTPEHALFRIRFLITIVALVLLVVSGFTPAALAYLAELSEQFPENRGGMMGLYSVFLGIGQLLGGWLGGLFAESWGVDGLILGTAILGLAANLCLFLITRGTIRGMQQSPPLTPSPVRSVDEG